MHNTAHVPNATGLGTLKEIVCELKKKKVSKHTDKTIITPYQGWKLYRERKKLFTKKLCLYEVMIT